MGLKISGRQVGKTFFVLLGLVFFFPSLSLAAPDAAGDPGVEITAEVGWEGWAMPGRYAPAVIHLRNKTAADLDGAAEIIDYGRYVPPPLPGSPPGTKPAGPEKVYPVSSFGERVFLPAGGEKKVVLWFPLQGGSGIFTARFRTGEQTLASVQTKLAAPFAVDAPFPQTVGVLGEMPPALERVRLVAPDGVPRAPTILKLKTELVPAAAEELDAFGFLLVSSEEACRLTAEQRAALFDWAALGGCLFLAGGAGIKETLALLPPEVEIISQGITVKNDWGAAAAWLAQPVPPDFAPVARLQGKGEPLGPAQDPLGRQVKVGEGCVTVFAFDPARPPWDAGSLGVELWAALLRSAQPYGEKMFVPNVLTYRYEQLAGVINNLPEAAFPDWRYVGVFLGVFLVAVGPVAYFFLRKKQRPEYMWLVAPLLALLFSGAAYFYTLWTGRDVIVNIAQVVDRINGPQNGLAFTEVGFFAPARPVFNAVIADPGRPVKALYYGNVPPELRAPDEEPPYAVVKGADLKATFREMSQWEMRRLAFRQDIGGALDGLRAEFSITDGRLWGRVHNDTALALEHVTLFLGHDYRVLGALAPGQGKDVEMEITPPAYDSKIRFRPGYFPVWPIFVHPEGAAAALEAAAARGNPDYFGPPSRRLTVEEQRRSNALETILNFQRHGRGMEFQGGRPLALVAFSKEPAGQVQIKGLRARLHCLCVFLIKPELSIPPGSFYIPAGLAVPEVAGAQITGMFGRDNMFGIAGGNITYVFRPGLPEGAQCNEIEIQFPYYPSLRLPGAAKKVAVTQPSPTLAPAEVEPGVLEVYNPTNGQWQELAGAKTFRLPGEYALFDGEVRLRVNGFDASTGKEFYFLPPTVAYRGVKK